MLKSGTPDGPREDNLRSATKLRLRLRVCEVHVARGLSLGPCRNGRLHSEIVDVRPCPSGGDASSATPLPALFSEPNLLPNFYMLLEGLL